MTSGNPTLSTIYKIAWAIDVYPRDFFYRMAPDGSIIEEPKVSFEKLKEYAERERLGPLFAQEPQKRTASIGVSQLRHRVSRYQHSAVCRGEEWGRVGESALPHVMVIAYRTS